jgi:hypothetical protein
MCQTQGCIILDDIPDALLCFPLSHTKSFSISYHQECRVNPNLLTHLDDGVTRFLFSPPANWDFPWSLFHTLPTPPLTLLRSIWMLTWRPGSRRVTRAQMAFEQLRHCWNVSVTWNPHEINNGCSGILMNFVEALWPFQVYRQNCVFA